MATVANEDNEPAGDSPKEFEWVTDEAPVGCIFMVGEVRDETESDFSDLYVDIESVSSQGFREGQPDAEPQKTRKLPFADIGQMKMYRMMSGDQVFETLEYPQTLAARVMRARSPREWCVDGRIHDRWYDPNDFMDRGGIELSKHDFDRDGVLIFAKARDIGEPIPLLDPYVAQQQRRPGVMSLVSLFCLPLQTCFTFWQAFVRCVKTSPSSEHHVQHVFVRWPGRDPQLKIEQNHVRLTLWDKLRLVFNRDDRRDSLLEYFEFGFRTPVRVIFNVWRGFVRFAWCFSDSTATNAV